MIRAKTANGGKITIDDVAEIQNDVHTLLFNEMLPIIKQLKIEEPEYANASFRRSYLDVGIWHGRKD